MRSAQSWMNLKKLMLQKSPSLIYQRVEKKGIKCIVLLQNKFRLDQIQRLNEFMHSDQNRSKVTGSRGVGKSHFLALFILHSRMNILHDSPNRRIMYINDPALYFQNFSKIKDDIAYFMGSDYLDNEQRRQEFEKALELCLVETASKFMDKLIKYYHSEKISCDLVIDQYNNLESNKNKDEFTYKFFKDLINIFGMKVLISASNDNETLRTFEYNEIQVLRIKTWKIN